MYELTFNQPCIDVLHTSVFSDGKNTYLNRVLQPHMGLCLNPRRSSILSQILREIVRSIHSQYNRLRLILISGSPGQSLRLACGVDSLIKASYSTLS